MARVGTHLSVSDLERHYRAAKDGTAARHYQAIWLLAKGHTVPAVAEMTSFGTRWLEQLLSRYNARGPTALGDQRRHNGRAPSILKPALLERLVLGRRPIRAQPRRHRLHALARPRQQKPRAIRSHRRHSIGMAKTTRQRLDIARKPSFTALVRALKIHPRPPPSSVNLPSYHNILYSKHLLILDFVTQQD